MCHRWKERRPQVKTLESYDVYGAIDGHVKNLAVRKRFEIAGLLFDSPCPINRGVNPLCNYGLEDLNYARSI
jgi:hypothetical protein